MTDHASRVRLLPGTRLSERGYGAWQLGLHDDRRVVLTPDAADHLLVTRLRTGVDPDRLGATQRSLLDQLDEAGLLISCAAAPPPPPMTLDAPAEHRAAAARALADAGLTVADGPSALTLVVSVGAEQRREALDPLVRADRPHLLLTAVAGRVRIGPLVVPGATACLRCVDEHHTDLDPRHPLVVHHHLERDLADRPAPGDLALGLAWAARDARAYVCDGAPSTWSATVDLTDDAPAVRAWSRHPRCGCAWDEALLA
jgi:hypothetical protein